MKANAMSGILSFLKRFWSISVVSTFLTGLFVLLPIVITVMIFNWMITKVIEILGPGTLLGDALLSGGGSIVGPNHSVIAFVLGFGIMVCLIWIFGVFVRVQAKRKWSHEIDRLFARIPLIRAVYKPVSQMVKLLAGDGEDKMKGMRVVACRIGGPGGVDVLGLVTTPQTYDVGGCVRQLVYLPTSPVPMSGGLLLVPADTLIAMPDISVDELMQIYLSLGVVMPEAILHRPQVQAPT